LNQEVISVITELMFFWNSSGLALDIIMVVSSANSIGLANLLTLRERSFMYIRNSNGPSFEPCGTTCFTCIQLEDMLCGLLLYTDTLWYLFSDRISLVCWVFQRSHKASFYPRVFHDWRNQMLFVDHRIFHQQSFFFQMIVHCLNVRV